jgi:hypothetical protein
MPIQPFHATGRWSETSNPFRTDDTQTPRRTDAKGRPVTQPAQPAVSRDPTPNGPSTAAPRAASPPSAAAPAQTPAQRQARLQPQIDTIKEALRPQLAIGLVVPRFGSHEPIQLDRLKTVNATLASVTDPKDRSFIISQLSDQELHTLFSGTGDVDVGFGMPAIPTGQGPQFDAQYRTLFSTLGNSLDGYQAHRVLAQLPDQRRAAFVSEYVKRASPTDRQKFAETAVSDPNLSDDRKRQVLQAVYAQATPEQRSALLQSPALHQFAQDYLGRHADASAAGSATGSGPLTAEDVFRGDGVGWRQAGSPQEAAILEGDQAVGTGHIDTPLEHKLLKKWLYGDGSPYVMTDAELNAVKTDPAVQEVSQRIASGQVRTAPVRQPDGTTRKEGTLKLSDGSTVRVSEVTLADGSRGYAANVSFLTRHNELDGSIGKGHVTFDASGQPVGIVDTYDFSNRGASVDATNLAGASVGARNYLVTGGLVESTLPEVPADPTVASSGKELGEDAGALVVGKVTDGAKSVGGKVADGGRWVADRAGDGAGWVRDHLPFLG